MAKLKASERRNIEAYFEMGSGGVLDFTNRTFYEFFSDELDVNIYSNIYSEGGESKAKRLRTFLNVASQRQAARALRALWDYKKRDIRDEFKRRMALSHYVDNLEALDIEMGLDGHEDDEFESFVYGIEARGDREAVNAASLLAVEFNLDSVSIDIDRARSFLEDDPESAITASCSLLESLCRSILIEVGEGLPKDKSIMPLYKETAKILQLSAGRDGIDPLILDDVRKVLSGLNTLIEGIGALRTHGGNAHGRNKGSKRIDVRIARLAVNSATGAAVFLIETWERVYPERALRNISAEVTPK